MKQTIIIIAMLVASVTTFAQNKPRKHVFYDTVKTIKQRVECLPDTIPVFFKELNADKENVSEAWTKGFIIWHPYLKISHSQTILWTDSATYQSVYKQPDFYRNDYLDNIYFVKEQFLYLDKTGVTNKVINYFKR